MTLRNYFLTFFIDNVISCLIQPFFEIFKIFFVQIDFVLFVEKGTVFIGVLFTFCNRQIVITSSGFSYIKKISSSSCSKRSEEHTSELQSRGHLVCRLLLEKKNHK